LSLAHETSFTSLNLDARVVRRSPALAGTPAMFRYVIAGLAHNWLFGELTFVMPSGRELHIKGAEPGPAARLVVRDVAFIHRILRGGVIGFAEGYIAGEWDSPDLAGLLDTMCLNLDPIQTTFDGNVVVRAINQLRHLLRMNTRRGSKRNITAHYDLGNAFYSRWLDPTMTYSSALYDQPGQPLDQAQMRKYEALAKSIGLQRDQHVLEIGCGWGGFAEYAAREVGARVTAVTISEEQHSFAQQRMFEQGLAERTDIRLMDYRDVEGRFDRVASIEMFEAVGERYWPTYFNKLHDVLEPGGRAGLQIITIRDDLFDGYKNTADFIQKYIFPGGMLPSEEKLRKQTDRAGLDWTGITRFGQHYADTLLEWVKSFDDAWEDIATLGFDERFRRLWRFYLCYCEAGFRSGRTDVVQLSLAKA
jgi:cyclopropane-fatty-acyl-phospholipid synthase